MSPAANTERPPMALRIGVHNMKQSVSTRPGTLEPSSSRPFYGLRLKEEAKATRRMSCRVTFSYSGQSSEPWPVMLLPFSTGFAGGNTQFPSSPQQFPGLTNRGCPTSALAILPIFFNDPSHQGHLPKPAASVFFCGFSAVG